MKKGQDKGKLSCKIIGHMSLILMLVSGIAVAQNIELDASLLNPLAKVSSSRTPANFTPTDDVGYIPMVQEIEVEVNDRLKDDNGGTLRSMRERFNYWQEREEYAEVWNLESTGLYDTPNYESKRSYFEKNMLKYFDRRLSGEIKSAKSGSALSRVKTVEQALRPDTKVQVSENIKIRFSARPIQQYATVQVVNPYVKVEMQYKLDGDIDVKLSKEFQEYRVKTEVNYDVDQGRYIASVNKQIAEHWAAQIASTQNDNELPGMEETTYRLNYSIGF